MKWRHVLLAAAEVVRRRADAERKGNAAAVAVLLSVATDLDDIAKKAKGGPKLLSEAFYEAVHRAASAAGQRYDRDGTRLTDCCGAYSTISGGLLCCRACYEVVQSGEGDGSERRPTT